ncbi:MAG: methylglyoxal synthase [Chthonomonadales bacterium]
MMPDDLRKEYVALIAHDDKKDDMIEFVNKHREILRAHNLVATNTTGTIIEAATGIPVTKMLSGPLGGDLQIGALIATDQVMAVIFLRDPLTAHPHEPDIAALMKVCDTHNIPLASNVATAELIVRELNALKR